MQVLPFKPKKTSDLLATEITMLAFVLRFQSLPFFFYPYQHQVCLPHGLLSTGKTSPVLLITTVATQTVLFLFPLPTSYLCLKKCLIKLCITLHQIPVFPHCTPHPYSQVSTIYSPGGKKKKKKNISVVHKSGYHKYSLLWGGKKKIRKHVFSFCNIQCFKIKPFIACWGELNHNLTTAYSKKNSVIFYDLINAYLTLCISLFRTLVQNEVNGFVLPL